MRLALHMPGEPGERWDLARQMGVTDLVCGVPLGADGTPAADREALDRLCDTGRRRRVAPVGGRGTDADGGRQARTAGA